MPNLIKESSNYAYQDEGQQGITYVVTKNDDRQWVEVHQKTDIERACQEEYQARFRQANDTPFMKSPLVEDFGYLSIGENAQDILNGTYSPKDGTNEYAIKLLNQLKWTKPREEAGSVRSWVEKQCDIASNII